MAPRPKNEKVILISEFANLRTTNGINISVSNSQEFIESIVGKSLDLCDVAKKKVMLEGFKALIRAIESYDANSDISLTEYTHRCVSLHLNHIMNKKKKVPDIVELVPVSRINSGKVIELKRDVR
jgi:DNA-directed RNA polymerase specialized sigma subunit